MKSKKRKGKADRISARGVKASVQLAKACKLIEAIYSKSPEEGAPGLNEHLVRYGQRVMHAGFRLRRAKEVFSKDCDEVLDQLWFLFGACARAEDKLKPPGNKG